MLLSQGLLRFKVYSLYSATLKPANYCWFAACVAHDFFSPQPIREPAIFYLRGILIDWPDEPSVTILRNLRDAAGPQTQLVIQDAFTYYTCEDSQDALGSFGQSLHALPPKPIPPNWGNANAYPYCVDMLVRGSLASLLAKG